MTKTDNEPLTQARNITCGNCDMPSLTLSCASYCTCVSGHGTCFCFSIVIIFWLYTVVM